MARKRTRPDAAERIANYAALRRPKKKIKIRIRRAIRAATKAERQRCVGIVLQEKAMTFIDTKKSAPMVCDDIIRDITTTSKASSNKSDEKVRSLPRFTRPISGGSFFNGKKWITTTTRRRRK